MKFNYNYLFNCWAKAQLGLWQNIKHKQAIRVILLPCALNNKELTSLLPMVDLYVKGKALAVVVALKRDLARSRLG